jgi:uncharacterized protein
MIVKVHSTPNGKMLAICDSDLLGKTIEDDERRLDLSANFYKGESRTEEEITDLLEDAYVVNAVGEKSVALLVKKRLVEKDCIMSISGVPYAQCVVERG